MFPDINPESPESINSIKDTNDAQRSKAKAPHFAYIDAPLISNG